MTQQPEATPRCSRWSMLWLVVVCWLSAACLWDSETLRQERSRFPSTLELISGKFLRHSPDYYVWRRDAVTKQIAESGPTPELLDDLAVSLDKLGQHAEAIATMEEAERLFPGRYETAANLGTFYFHSQHFEAGIPYIERALEINPDAHFGREQIQLMLVRYLLSRGRAGEPISLPLRETELAGDPPVSELKWNAGFAKYLLEHHPEAESAEAQAKILHEAQNGILGMMRFGNHTSPILLEGLGDVLFWDDLILDQPRQLAARAYLKASYEVQNPAAARLYRQRAAVTLKAQTKGKGGHTSVTLEQVEREFRQELQDAEQWYATLLLNEQDWIKRAGEVDPAEEFGKLYQSEPKVVVSNTSGVWTSVNRSLQWVWIPAMLLGAGLAALAVANRLAIRRSRRPIEP